MVFVDTNYFLRFLLKDNSSQSQKAINLFQKASLGQVKLDTSVIVIFEIYWVLKSFYKKNNQFTQKILSDILKMEFIDFENYEILKLAIYNLSYYNFDLEDAYNCFYASRNKIKIFKTFDQKLKNKFKLIKGEFN